MNDVEITMVGNVLSEPEWRRTTQTNTVVMTFRFASHTRRFDRTSGRWIDGDSLKVRVRCWRNLGENGRESIRLGDPLVVFGRLYSREWTDGENTRRTSYEVDAITIGHDLSRGTATFTRRKAGAITQEINDAESETVIGGEPSMSIGSPDDEFPGSGRGAIGGGSTGDVVEGDDEDDETDEGDDLNEELGLIEREASLVA